MIGIPVGSFTRTDSAQYNARMHSIAEHIGRMETELTRFQQMKPYLDSLIESNRAQKQKEYGNQEIARQIRIARTKFEDIEKEYHGKRFAKPFTAQDSARGFAFNATTLLDWLEHPLLIPAKPLPGLLVAGVDAVPTVLFNGAVLLIMSLVATMVALVLLSMRGSFLEALRGIFRIKPQQQGGQSA